MTRLRADIHRIGCRNGSKRTLHLCVGLSTCESPFAYREDIPLSVADAEGWLGQKLNCDPSDYAANLSTLVGAVVFQHVLPRVAGEPMLPFIEFGDLENRSLGKSKFAPT